MRIGTIDAYAQNHRAGFVVLRKIALKILRFHRATAGHVLRIKIENDPFALEIFQADLRSVAGRQSKFRRRLAGGRLRGLTLSFCALHKSECSQADDCEQERSFHDDCWIGTGIYPDFWKSATK